MGCSQAALMLNFSKSVQSDLVTGTLAIVLRVTAAYLLGTSAVMPVHCCTSIQQYLDTIQHLDWGLKASFVIWSTVHEWKLAVAA